MLLKNNSAQYKKGFLIYLIIYFVLFSSCNPAQKIARNNKVDKKEIQKEVIPKYLKIFGELSYDKKKYRIYKAWITAFDKDQILLKKVDRFNGSKLYGPYLDSDSTLYFLKKLKTLSPLYGNYAFVQIPQNFGMSDDLFQEELDLIKSNCQKEKQLLPDFIETYQSKNQLNIGISLELKDIKLEELVPEVVAFLKKAPIYGVFQSEKHYYLQTDFIELIQKTSQPVVKKHIEYLKIIVKKTPPEDVK